MARIDSADLAEKMGVPLLLTAPSTFLSKGME
jgi:hypothetical protein